MIHFVYSLILLLGVVCFIPYMIWEKGWASIRLYFGGVAHSPQKKKTVFLLYAVSVGEVKAAQVLVEEIKKKYPNSVVCVATRTMTGYKEAKKSLSLADYHTFLPFDFACLMKRFLGALSPDVVLVIEGDLWFNFLRIAKKRGAFIALVSGKISERSYRRLRTVSFFSRRLFSYFDLICAQERQFADRFSSLGAKRVEVTGNLKYGNVCPLLSEEKKKALRASLKIQDGKKVVVLGSTHEPEEKMFLNAMSGLEPYILLLVPRHEDRFAVVEKLIQSTSIPSGTYLKRAFLTGQEKIILIDKMGILTDLYQIADVAIVAGSFSSELKGHNILEPIFAKVPTLFGPYMENQSHIVRQVLRYQAAKQVSFAEALSYTKHLLGHAQERSSLLDNATYFAKQLSLEQKTTFDAFFSSFTKNI